MIIKLLPIMNTISYIENNLEKISELSTLEKFDLLLSSSNAINKYLDNVELVKALIKNIESLRYELAYSKGIEALSYRLDKVLAYEALRLSRIVFKGKDLTKAINDVLYYEINDGMKQELQKDRIRGEHDYKINLKAELEIKLLSEKIDHLLVHQNKKLLEIQEVQTDYLEDLMKVLKTK